MIMSNVARADILERRRDAGQQFRRTKIDVLIQLETHLEQDFGFENPCGICADPRGSTPTAPNRIAS